MDNYRTYLIVLIVLLIKHTQTKAEEKRKICHGTSKGMSLTGNSDSRYLAFRDHYRGCAIVEGNLEITHFLRNDYNMSFLEDIEEVTGYVLVGNCNVRVIPLNKLRLIRGRNLFETHFSLYVFENYADDGTEGMQEIGLKLLTEISEGSVSFRDNPFLCYVDTIDWTQILPGKVDNNSFVQRHDEEKTKVKCPLCATDCLGHCWSNASTMCQSMTRNCDAHCRDRGDRCFGPDRTDCCDQQCAAGCTGPHDNQCFFCQFLKDGDACVSQCPPQNIFDRKTMTNKPNPDAKFIYGSECVKECPEHLSIEGGACVAHCAPGHQSGPERKCLRCDGPDSSTACQAECNGTGNYPLNASNIDSFVNCSIVRGNLRIQQATFTGHLAISLRRLWALKDIKEIKDYLLVDADVPELVNLNFLANLKVIRGQHPHNGVHSLRIYKSSLFSLGLNSLHRILNSNVFIKHNRRLCFVDTVNFTKFFPQRSWQDSKQLQEVILEDNGNATYCELSPCSSLCTSDGCMGPNDDQCIGCVGLHFEGTCLSSCEIYEPLRLYRNNSGQCAKCHPECDDCTGPDNTDCIGCRHLRVGNACVGECPASKYADVSGNCSECSHACLNGCTGPAETLGPGGCRVCRLKLRSSKGTECYSSREDPRCSEFEVDNRDQAQPNITELNCTQCPDWSVYIPDEESCVSQSLLNQGRMEAIISGVVTSGSLVVGVVILLILLIRRQLARTEEKKLQLTAKINGVVECEPLTPSNAKPDMSVLRLINESELRRKNVIGSGAFGTVYKGFWVPEGDRVNVPVAVKVLHRGSGQGVNLLEEARIMASVDHPCCVRVLAVCMATEMMLITQLMPLGCLLDYVRKNRDNVGSKVLLNWCTQIARGMNYLGEIGIIHRDLAARNVLVQSPHHVKITDFGLAKVVTGNGELHASGGKWPIKWLALESIQHQVFTHKSDVWSFGVTTWELFTYGQRPYDGIGAKEVLNLLEKGERLPQPYICTIDVYMIMIKCWMLDADSRPSFAELAEEFAKMARDPARYLVIQNDSGLRLVSHPMTTRDLLKFMSLDSAETSDDVIIVADDYINDLARKNTQNKERNIVAGTTSASKHENTPLLHLSIPRCSSSQSTSGPESPRYSPDPSFFAQPFQRPKTGSREADAGKSERVAPPSAQTSDNNPQTKSFYQNKTYYVQVKPSAPVAYLELLDESDTGDISPETQKTPEVAETSRLLRETKTPRRVTTACNPEYFCPESCP